MSETYCFKHDLDYWTGGKCPKCEGEKVQKVVCGKCGQTYLHLHDTAYDLGDTHMEGSERFECKCGPLSRETAEKYGLKYVLDLK